MQLLQACATSTLITSGSAPSTTDHHEQDIGFGRAPRRVPPAVACVLVALLTWSSPAMAFDVPASSITAAIVAAIFSLVTAVATHWLNARGDEIRAAPDERMGRIESSITAQEERIGAVSSELIRVDRDVIARLARMEAQLTALKEQLDATSAARASQDARLLALDAKLDRVLRAVGAT